MTQTLKPLEAPPKGHRAARKSSVDMFLLHGLQQICTVVDHMVEARVSGTRLMAAARAMSMHTSSSVASCIALFTNNPPNHPQHVQALQCLVEYRRRVLARDPLLRESYDDVWLKHTEDVLQLVRVLHTVLLGKPEHRTAMVRAFRKGEPLPKVTA